MSSQSPNNPSGPPKRGIPKWVTFGGDSPKQDKDVDSESMKGQMLELEIARFKGETKQKGDLVSWTKEVVGAWLASVIFIVLFNKLFGIGLSDTVLITLLGTTTANVLVLSYTVLKGFFDKDKSTVNNNLNKN